MIEENSSVIESGFGGYENVFVAIYTDKDGILLAEIDGHAYAPQRVKEYAPNSKNLLGFIAVARGSMKIRLDSVTHICTSTQDNIVTISPNASVKEVSVSRDFKGYLLLIKRSFLLNNMSFTGFTPIPFNRNPTSKDAFCYTVSPHDRQLVVDGIMRVERRFARDTHKFQREVILLSTIETLLDIMDIIMTKQAIIRPQKPTKDRKDDISRRFYELLSEHGKRLHEVQFYADLLCITPPYLSKILRQTAGVSANKIIYTNVVNEATRQLRHTNNTISVIADKLGFADQASFSKFFRKHTGETPGRFRKHA